MNQAGIYPTLRTAVRGIVDAQVRDISPVSLHPVNVTKPGHNSPHMHIADSISYDTHSYH